MDPEEIRLRPPVHAVITGAERAFIGMVVHELRGPLTVALGQAELLAESGEAFDPTARSEMARDILESVVRLEALLGDLTLIAAAGEGTLRSAAEPVDLGAALQTALGDGREGGPGSPLAGLPAARGDAAQVVRILGEVIAAARRADPGTEPRISGHTDETTGMLTVEVIDSGPSVPLQERAVALDKFRRLPGQALRSRRVHPFGLTLARVLAESMAGRLEIDDPPGGTGCLVRLVLPLA